jgi:hypothetical protein
VAKYPHHLLKESNNTPCDRGVAETHSSIKSAGLKLKIRINVKVTIGYEHLDKGGEA